MKIYLTNLYALPALSEGQEFDILIAAIFIAVIVIAWVAINRYIERESQREAKRTSGMTEEQRVQDLIDRSL